MTATRFSKTHGFWDEPLLVALSPRTMSGEFKAGLAYGLEVAAAACKAHIIMQARRHGESSPQVAASELDLYCIQRGLRKFRREALVAEMVDASISKVDA